MDKRKIIIDTDPGIDDCYAIMLATLFDKFEILGITCVAGNKSLPVVTANALRIMDFQKKDIPVSKGAKAALAKLRKREDTIINTRNESGSITTVTTDDKIILMEYYEKTFCQ